MLLLEEKMSELPKQARLVIVGAGIVGCSAAYHLTQLGWKDIVVVDQGPLYETGGSTSHAPGSVFGTNPSKMMQRMAKYTTDLLLGRTFHGEQIWYPVGSIEVAGNKDRLQELWRRHGHATSWDVESHILSPQEVKERVPLIDESMILGGLYRPTDGNAKAWKAAGSLALAAIATGGVEFYGHTLVNDIELDEKGRVKGLATNNGRISTDQILLCTNIWGPVLASKVGVTLPMMACSHHYGLTEELPELSHIEAWIEQPIVRYQEKSAYYRQWDKRWASGSYRHEPRLVYAHQIGKDAYWEWNEADWKTAVIDAEELFPTLKGREYTQKINGMFVFSTDGYPMMGETHVPGLWTAIGIWVTHSGGAGKAIAEMMTTGHPEWDMHEADVNRFHDFQKTRAFIFARSWQNYAEVYDIIHPKQQMEKPRNVRLAPYHVRLVAQKAEFWPVSGWEVAQWYGENLRLMEKYDDQVPERSGWEARYWSRIQGAEHLAVRESGGLFNLANFTKLEVSGAGATAFLNYLAANQIDRPAGQVVYTALLDSAGCIKSDLTVTRMDGNTYWVLTGAGGGPHDLAWIRQNMPADGSVVVRDMTSQLTAVGLWGPNARRVLEKVADEDVSNEAFPYMTAKAITIGTIQAYALRLSYAGELGWEIYCSSEQGLALWDALWEAGREFDIIAAGAGCFGSLRLEKGYRAWGSDIHTEVNPYEAGLGWAVRLNKGDFMGREALVKAKAEGLKQKLCVLTSSDPQAVAMGSEPVLTLDGKKIGFVTSVDYGYSVGKLIMLAMLPIEYAVKGTEVRVRYFDGELTAVVAPDPLFDPQMERLKG